MTTEEAVVLVTTGTMAVIGTGVGRGARSTGEMPVLVLVTRAAVFVVSWQRS